MLEPTPPHNIEAEQALLGALLAKPEIYADISLSADHFYAPQHQRIFSKLAAAFASGRGGDAVSLRHIFDNDPELSNNGGGQYLIDLQQSVVTFVNARNYAGIIKECSNRRRMLSICAELKEKCFTDTDITAEAERLLTTLSEPEARTLSGGEAVERAFALMEKLRKGGGCVSTGFGGLDAMIGGLHSGCLYIIAARPGMGKTALALNIADQISKTEPAVFFSLEMPAEELAMRLLAARTNVPVGIQRSTSTLHKAQWDRLVEAQADLRSRRLVIEDAAGVNIQSIMTAARRHKRKMGKFTLFIDYLGLIAGDRSINNKVHQIEAITTSLKTLAKELEIPVVLLSQLNRGLEQRSDKRPMLSDLRDSGAIEQDADVVMFVYREAVYARQAEAMNAKAGPARQMQAVDNKSAEIIIEKNRQGENGTVYLNFDGTRQRFHEGAV